MNKLLVILGPTATGKTDLGINLAKNFNGELIACDSRQVYQSLDIGTGKLPGGQLGELDKGNGWWRINGVKIWMYDVADPKEQYTVADYVKDTIRVIEEITNRGKLPIIVAGTGFYLKGLLEGFPSLIVPINQELRGKLSKLSKKGLQGSLKRLAIDRWKSLNESDKENPRRLLRSIELVLMNPNMNTLKKNGGLGNRFSVLKIGLTAPRLVLYERADLRVLSRIDQGMIKEARSLYQDGLSFERMMQLGLEYRVLADYLEGVIKSRDEFVKSLQNKIHGYLRRQLTWFKKEKDVNWFDITDRNYSEKVEKLASKWYHSR